MPFTKEPWESPESKLSSDDFAKVCLIDLNKPGKEKIKELCKLPVKSTPNGPYNINGLSAAANALLGARGGLKDVPREMKIKAARRLISLLREAQESVPEGLYRLVGERPPEK